MTAVSHQIPLFSCLRYGGYRGLVSISGSAVENGLVAVRTYPAGIDSVGLEVRGCSVGNGNLRVQEHGACDLVTVEVYAGSRLQSLTNVISHAIADEGALDVIDVAVAEIERFHLASGGDRALMTAVLRSAERVHRSFPEDRLDMVRAFVFHILDVGVETARHRLGVQYGDVAGELALERSDEVRAVVRRIVLAVRRARR